MVLVVMQGKHYFTPSYIVIKKHMYDIHVNVRDWNYLVKLHLYLQISNQCIRAYVYFKKMVKLFSDMISSFLILMCLLIINIEL